MTTFWLNFLIGVLGTLTTAAIIGLIVMYGKQKEQNIEINSLKEWKLSHITDHNNHDLINERTFEKIFEKFDRINQKLDTLIGSCNSNNRKKIE